MGTQSGAVIGATEISPSLPPALVDAILDYAGEHPTHGPRTIAAALTLPRFGSWQVSASGVYQVLVRARLNRTRMRLAAAELLAATAGGPVTEGALRDLRAVQRQIAHKGSDVVGRSVFFDTTYVGNLKGVGKIWQYSVVDGACSFGFAHARVGPKTATDFLEQHVLPMYRELSVALVEVVTRRRPQSPSGATSAAPVTGSGSAGANCHRVRPNLNGFVERFQSTVLHQHYRTAFRYRFYDDIDVLDADLQAWLRHYNFERRTAATGWPAAAQPTSPTPPAQTCPSRKDGPMHPTQPSPLSALGRKPDGLPAAPVRGREAWPPRVCRSV